jgi:peptidoglycan/xylan/chitin deacetylase (PgdA/CDA1 family)
MRVRGLGRLRRAARSIKRRLSHRALILMYHRVAELGCDPWDLAVTPEHFRQHLEVLRKHGRLMRNDQLAASLERGKLPDRAVVLTFDDGYADNLLAAKPLLEKYDVPATVFIATGYVGGPSEFWWDELERVFLQPGKLPDVLRLNVNGKAFEWNLQEATDYSERAYQDNRRWKAWEAGEAGSRQLLFRSLWEWMHPLTESDRQQVRDDLLSWAGNSSPARSTHRTLFSDEVLKLAEGGLVEVGCHTVTHPKLAALPSAMQREEIHQSKARLEEILGSAVITFAYPYGLRSDYTDETVAMIRGAGFKSAYSTSRGMVDRRVNRFELPRYRVGNIDGDAFSSQLRHWFAQ